MNKVLTASVIAAIGLAGPAMGSTILSFGFTDLSGSFNPATMAYTAAGVNTATLHSGGNVNRLQDPVGSAIYNPGSAAGLILVSLTVSNVVGNSAQGTGTIFIEDADGDRFVADISGSFSLVAPAVFFNGALDNVAFVPGPGTNNQFNGPSGGSFPLTFAPAPPPYTGAVVQLYFDAGTFFSAPFQDISTQVSGAVIPTPASAAILGFGALFASRRRRMR